jgi:hypothetical protein
VADFVSFLVFNVLYMPFRALTPSRESWIPERCGRWQKAWALSENQMAIFAQRAEYMVLCIYGGLGKNTQIAVHAELGMSMNLLSTRKC